MLHCCFFCFSVLTIWGSEFYVTWSPKIALQTFSKCRNWDYFGQRLVIKVGIEGKWAGLENTKLLDWKFFGSSETLGYKIQAVIGSSVFHFGCPRLCPLVSLFLWKNWNWCSKDPEIRNINFCSALTEKKKKKRFQTVNYWAVPWYQLRGATYLLTARHCRPLIDKITNWSISELTVNLGRLWESIVAGPTLETSQQPP